MILQGDIAAGVRFIEAIIERNIQLSFMVDLLNEATPLAFRPQPVVT